MCGEQPIRRFRVRADERVHRGIRPRRVAGNDRDHRFVAQILTGERSFFGELFPEIERTDLMGAGKETRHGP